MYTITFSMQAFETFDLIKEQIRMRWGDKAVNDFDQKTIRVLDVLEESPFVYQAIASNLNIRRSVIHRNCSMFYEIRDLEVEVLFFLDNRQDPLI